MLGVYANGEKRRLIIIYKYFLFKSDKYRGNLLFLASYCLFFCYAVAITLQKGVKMIMNLVYTALTVVVIVVVLRSMGVL